MKRLERMVDLIGVMGIERSGVRLNFQESQDDLLNRKIQEKMSKSALAHRSLEALLSIKDGVVTVKESDVSTLDRKVLMDMIQQVQGIRAFVLKDT